jgi:histidinol phosphatase-like PHP family hydrolase
VPEERALSVADLHIHTRFSDGADSPADVVEHAVIVGEEVSSRHGHDLPPAEAHSVLDAIVALARS